MDISHPHTHPADPNREPLVTGHKTHDELVEKGRIEQGTRNFGRGIPLYPQAMIYVILIAVLAFIGIYMVMG